MNDLARSINPTPISVSNVDFLQEVFGKDKWKHAHVTAFAPDPTALDKTGERHLWAGAEAQYVLRSQTGALNTFFTISLFNPGPDGIRRRRKAQFNRTYAIVLDDVGLRGIEGTSAKVSPDKIKLKPSWTLETSPGNWQVGYMLSGDGDPRGGKVVALLSALVDSGLVSDGSDPGMKGVTRYVRLPEGTNTKAKYGKSGFAHVIGSWKPENKYTLEEIALAYGVRSSVDDASSDLGAGAVGDVDPGTDRGAKVLGAAGVPARYDESKKLWQVECPFIEEHTGREDSGTAYLGNGRWQCYHGHCENRDDAEFNAKLRAEHPEAFRSVLVSEMAGFEIEGAQAEAPGASDAEMGEIFGPLAVAEHKVAAVLPSIFSLKDAVAAGPVLDIPWLVEDIIPPEGMGVVYGKPGTGKSFVAIDLACRMAAGRGWHGGDYLGPASPVVVYVASEGGQKSVQNRFLGWVSHNAGSVPDVRVYPGALALGTEGDTEQVSRFCTWLNSLGSVVMVVLDTFARNVTGDENSSRDMGAALADVDLIRRGCGGFVMLVHHSGKDAARGARGHSSLNAAIDVEMELTREEGAVSSVPGNIRMSKTREGDAMGQNYGYQLVKVPLGTNSRGKTVDTLAVDRCAAPGVAVKVSDRQARSSRLRDACLKVFHEQKAGDWVDIEDLKVWLADEEGNIQKPAYYKGKIKGFIERENGWETMKLGDKLCVKLPGL